MPVFQISSRSAQVTAPPKKSRVRIPYQWSFVIRLILGLNIAGSIFGRLKQLIVDSPSDTSGASFIDFLLQELKCFTGEGWEQEDDVTLVVLQRIAAPSLGVEPPAAHSFYLCSQQ